MPYFDHCATTPLDPRVAEAMDEARAEGWANPSSIHGPGRKARARLAEARARIAQRLAVSPAEIVFTSSATEANNLALKGAALAARGRPFHLVVSAIEHDSVLNTARYLAERLDWVRLTEVPTDESGLIAPEAVEAACNGKASLVSVLTVNNEIGTLQPIQRISEAAHRAGALFHTDAVQALGRIEFEPASMGCDLLTLCAHKAYGPRGAGLLYVRRGLELDPLVHGGTHEKDRRAGTENLLAAVGFARAVELACDEVASMRTHLAEVERAFLDALSACGVAFELNGSAADKVEGIVNLSVAGIESNDLVVGMDLEGFAISAGSACSSGVIEDSHVLSAMSIGEGRIRGGIRLSFGRSNTTSEAREGAQMLARLCERLAPGAIQISGKKT